VLSGLLWAAGCAQQQGAGVIETLPSATFNGPLVQPPAPPVYVPQPPPVVKSTIPEIKKPTMPSISVPRDWVPSVAKADGPWKYIVIHHSATPTGGAAAFDRMHRQKGWDELGYHFVIGNGSDTRDGAVEVGSRWPKQKHGAHAKTPDNEFNKFGIGICLVGNFDNDRLSAAQRQSLAKLVGYLMKTYNISASNVIAHGDTKATDCPGRNVHIAEVRRWAAQYVADSGGRNETLAKGRNAELLVDVNR
jgi:hypothetical protein